MSRNNVELRQFINDAFNDDELETFCFDNFPEVLNEIGGGLGLNRKAIILIRHCQNRGRQDDLETALAHERPGLWNARFGKKPVETVNIPNLVSLFDLLGLDRVEELNVLKKWQFSDPVRSLAVPIGIGVGGHKVLLDLHDKGHGPHGIVAGAPDSGKTLFLECLISILAASYHPHELCFMLVDFESSGFLQVVPELPHCISVLGSIEGKAEGEQRWYLARALKALGAEIRKRKKLLDERRFSDISEYHRLRRIDPSLSPMPRLVIIVDDFAELTIRQPDFLNGLVKLHGVGRALGMHLILSTQQPSGVVTDRISANSRFHLSMKFNRAEDSQAMLKRPDAAYIEQRGRGYLQVGDNEVFELFQGPQGRIPYEETGPEQLETYQPKQTQLKALVQYIRRETDSAGIQPVPNLLPDEFESLVTLEDIRSDGGWNGSDWESARAWLQPAIGILDDPTRQVTRSTKGIPLLRANLARFGHLFVFCDTTYNTRLPLRTLITSLALDHSPKELNIYALDSYNNALSIFKDLPHIADGGIIQASDSQRIIRLFRWLFTELEQRSELLAPSDMTWDQARQRGIDLGRPTIVLVVDNLILWKDKVDRRDELGVLINEGAQNGIHLILAGEARAATIFNSVLGGTSPCLTLGFPDTKAFRDIIGNLPYDQNVRGGFPEWGIYYDMDIGAIECRVVAPVRNGAPDEQKKNLGALVHEMKLAAERQSFPRPFSIGEMPLELPLATIMPHDIQQTWRDWSTDPKLRAPIGLDDLKLEPLEVDLEIDGPHFLIIGPPRGGKTAALHTWLLSLAARVPPQGLRLILFDNLRHTLAPLRELPHVRQFVSTPEEIRYLFAKLRDQLEDRAALTLDPPVVLVFDDLDQYDDRVLRSELARLVTQGASRGLYVLAAGRTADLVKYGDLEKALLKYRSGLFVGSNAVEAEATFLDAFLPLGLGREKLPAGRGYLVCQGEYHMVQVAMPGRADAVRELVKLITQAGEQWAVESRKS